MKINNKKSLKRIICYVLVSLLLISGSGCGASGRKDASSGAASGVQESSGDQTTRGGFIDRLNEASRDSDAGQPSQSGSSAGSGQAGQALFSSKKTEEVLVETGNSTSSAAPSEKKTVTLMIYMNGSNLESDGQCASDDLTEMLSSGIGENVNVIIQTMGTNKWHKFGISGDTAQTYRIKGGKLELVRDNLGKVECTSEETLAEFINFCKTTYPAERNILLFWDHGSGPIYGFGQDEWHDMDDGLTLSEMTRAFERNKDVHFDMIGMDCCIMASLETCYAFSPYCDYALLSEDFESGIGWKYNEWMAELEKNPGIGIPLLGKKIIDTIIRENETNPEGDSSSISLFNETTAVNLYNAWKAYAYKNQDSFFKKNYSRRHKSKGRGSGYGYGYGDEYDMPTLDEYYLTDLLALIESVDNSSDEAKTLTSALKAAVAYFGHTSDKNELTGMSVSLPYGDEELYKDLQEAYKDINLDKDYIDWLGNFVSATPDYYGYEKFEQSWGGWGSYDKEYGFDLSTGHCGSCAYDYNTGYFSGNKDSFMLGNWNYIYEYDMWYLEDGDMIYYYDEDSKMTYCYDDNCDCVYYYDDNAGEWVCAE